MIFTIKLRINKHTQYKATAYNWRFELVWNKDIQQKMHVFGLFFLCFFTSNALPKRLTTQIGKMKPQQPKNASLFRRVAFFVILPAFFMGCGKDANTTLRVVAEKANLYERPDGKSRIVSTLKKGQTLQETGTVSPFEQIILVQDTPRQAPWIAVRLHDKVRGWVHGAWVEPTSGDATTWLLENRMQAYFGTEVLKKWREPALNISSATDFAVYFRQKMALRDTMMQLLKRRPEPSTDIQAKRFDWLADAMPGFVFQLVSEGTWPWLFADYRFFQQKASMTPEQQDDILIAMYCAAFKTDSIESFFPAWKFQLDGENAASRLGEGTHLLVLKAIHHCMEQAPLFSTEALALKDELMEDICSSQVAYWYSSERIQSELSSIIQANLACFTERDRLALQQQLALFESLSTDSPRVNLRSGM
jgi:hypothetical protein